MLVSVAIGLSLVLSIALLWLLWQAERDINLGAEIALVALIAAVAAAGRVLTAALPNIQPTTVLMLLVGAHLGARRGAAVATLSTLIANMALGQGPWTLYQAIGWSAIAVLGRLLRTWLASNHPDGLHAGRLALVGALVAGPFDWWVSLSTLVVFQSTELFLIYLAQGLVFDLLHAIGNVAVALWIGPAIHRLLWLHARHRGGTWEPGEPPPTKEAPPPDTGEAPGPTPAVT